MVSPLIDNQVGSRNLVSLLTAREGPLAGRRGGRYDRGFDLLVIGEVDGERFDAREVDGKAIPRQDACACSAKPGRDGASDALGSAGDDGRAAREFVSVAHARLPCMEGSRGAYACRPKAGTQFSRQLRVSRSHPLRLASASSALSHTSGATASRGPSRAWRAETRDGADRTSRCRQP